MTDREKRREWSRQWQLRNKQQYTQYQQQYHATHKEELREAKNRASKHWAKTHPDVIQKNADQWQQTNPEAFKDMQGKSRKKYNLTPSAKKKQREARANHFIEYRLSQIRARAKKKGILFSLTSGNIHVPDICPILGIPLEKHATRETLENAWSVDRVDNTKGYTPDNIQIVSYRANVLKNGATTEELILLGAWAKKIKKQNVTGRSSRQH